MRANHICDSGQILSDADFAALGVRFHHDRTGLRFFAEITEPLTPDQHKNLTAFMATINILIDAMDQSEDYLVEHVLGTS